MTPQAKASPTPTPKPSFVWYMRKVGMLDKQTWHESWVHPCSNSLKMASFMFFPGNSEQNSLICLKMGYFMSFHRNSWPSSPFKKGAEIGGLGLGLGWCCFTSKNSAQSETNIELIIWKFEELGSNLHTRKTSEQNLKCEN